MTLHWRDFAEGERWKVAFGVWWRIIVMGILFWIALGILAVVLISAAD